MNTEDLWLDNLNLCRAAAINVNGGSFDKNKMILPTYFGSIEIIIEWPVESIAMVTEIVTHNKLFQY